MDPSLRRLALLLTLAVAVVGCESSTPSAVPASSTAPSRPGPTVPVATPIAQGAAPSRGPAASQPGRGGTVGGFPELSVSAAEPGYQIELVDPEAKAWRILVAGTGELAADRLELLVEVGDLSPGIEVRSIIEGKVAQATDLTGLVGDEAAAAGGCHPTLQICYGSGGMTIDPAEGRVSWVLERIEPGQFRVGGTTAGWPGEPFILGPWRTTAIFQTE